MGGPADEAVLDSKAVDEAVVGGSEAVTEVEVTSADVVSEADLRVEAAAGVVEVAVKRVLQGCD